MATPDWFTDCRTIFNRHPCPILSAIGATLITILVWYAHRIETQNDSNRALLQQIQIDVAVLRGFRERPDYAAPGGGVAMREAKD